MNRSPSKATLNGALIAFSALGLLAGSLVAGMLVGVGCSESSAPLLPYDDREQLCESMTAWNGMNWWLAVLSPALLLLVTQVFPPFRRHPLLPIISIVVVTGVGWTYLLLVVSNNIGDAS